MEWLALRLYTFERFLETLAGLLSRKLLLTLVRDGRAHLIMWRVLPITEEFGQEPFGKRSSRYSLPTAVLWGWTERHWGTDSTTLYSLPRTGPAFMPPGALSLTPCLQSPPSSRLGAGTESTLESEQIFVERTSVCWMFKILLIEQMFVKRTLLFLEKLLLIHRLFSLLWGPWTRV